MEYQDKMRILPSGIYKSYLLEKIFQKYRFRNPVLEIGGGTGEFIETMRGHKLKGEMIDINEDTIDHYRKKCSSVGLDMAVHNIDLFDYSPSKNFNSVFMFEILEHVEEDFAALNRIYNMLNYDGLFLMSVPAKQQLFSDEDYFQGHLRRYERKDLCKKMNYAGFEIIIFWCYNPFPYIIHFLMRENRKVPVNNKEIMQRTKDSSHNYYPLTKKLVELFYPFYSRLHFLLRFQNFFLNTDIGAHYLVIAKKS